jgi:hypothetical protein
MNRGISFRLTCDFALLTFLSTLIGCSSINKITNGNNIPGLSGVGDLSSILKSPSPITTSFSDTKEDQSLPAGFGNNMTPRLLTSQPKSPNNGYLLSPGFYEMTCRSYCLHAGTYGPAKGDGYLYAPLKGPKTAIIQAIVRNSGVKTSITQTTVQLLIWAVLARTSFKQLSPDLQIASVQLLSAEQLFELNGGALGLLPGSVLDQAEGTLPEPARQAIIAENNLRQLYSQSNATYQDFERVAVLAGLAPGSTVYPAGAWSRHPAGYFVRYYPSGYTRTRVQVYVPAPGGPGSTANADDQHNSYVRFASWKDTPPPVEYDASGNVAVPANTSAQRLQQTNTPVDGGGGNPGDGGTQPDTSNKPKKKCLDPNYDGRTIHAKDGNYYKLYDDQVLECPNLSLSGCGLPWWTNNPGSLTTGNPANPTGNYGSIPGITQPAPGYTFYIFPSYTAGQQALQNLVNSLTNITILQEMNKYAPASDPQNDPQKYAQGIATALGPPVTVDTKMGDLTAEQKQVVAKAIEQIEGYNNHPLGKTYSPDDPALPQEVRDKYKDCP